MAANGNFYITTAIPYVNAEPHLGHARGLCRPVCGHFSAGEERARGVGAEHRPARGGGGGESWFSRPPRSPGDPPQPRRWGGARAGPAPRRNEVLAFIRAGLADFS